MSLAFASELESELAKLEEEERENLEAFMLEHPEEFSLSSGSSALSKEKLEGWRNSRQRKQRSEERKRAYERKKRAMIADLAEHGIEWVDGRSLRRKLVSVKAIRIPAGYKKG